LDEALACFDHCLPVLREVGHQLWLAKTLVHRSATLQAAGREQAATAASREASAIFQDLGLAGCLASRTERRDHDQTTAAGRAAAIPPSHPCSLNGSCG
jgi:hypothetical protein